MNTQTNFQAANAGKRALGKHAGFQSEEEQPATKPAHTHSAGAMRAAVAVIERTGFTYHETDAAIIERHTNCGALLDFAENAVPLLYLFKALLNENWIDAKPALRVEIEQKIKATQQVCQAGDRAIDKARSVIDGRGSMETRARMDIIAELRGALIQSRDANCCMSYGATQVDAVERANRALAKSQA